MGKIHLLDQNVINLIAAGEVVERPASVIKELIENSVDAGSTKIVVKVKEGGIEQIEVQDNGSGISADDLPLVFAQHATSKLASAEDLNDIHTLGFRGEALASISSVSEVSLDTKTESDTGNGLSVSKGKQDTKPTTKTTTGTTIIVSQLFSAIPARKKFLKSAVTEFNHVQDTFTALALVNLHVHFELYHNDKLMLRLPSTKKFTERVFNIWSAQIAENLYPLEAEIPGGKLVAYIGKPDIGRRDRKLQYIFVNKRPVSDRLIQKAISDGYSGFLMKDLYPVYFVFLTLSPDAVDVNVHPRKNEIRLAQGGPVFAAINHQVSHCLSSSTKSDILDRIHASQPSRPWTEPIREGSHASPQTYTPSSASYRSPSNSFNSRPVSPVQTSLNFTAALLETEEGSQSGNNYVHQNISTPVQIWNTYIMYTQDEQLFFIDQHAAAEKILYEKLYNQMDHFRSRPLLTPDIVELAPKDKQKALAQSVQLSKVGIEIDDFGGNAIQVTHVPELTPNLDIAKFIQGLDDEPEEKPVGKITPELHLLIATMACHAAIRAGQPLTILEMQNLVGDLGKCQLPYNCPHGRPVSWTLSKYEVEKSFKRVK